MQLTAPSPAQKAQSKIEGKWPSTFELLREDNLHDKATGAAIVLCVTRQLYEDKRSNRRLTAFQKLDGYEAIFGVLGMDDNQTHVDMVPEKIRNFFTLANPYPMSHHTFNVDRESQALRDTIMNPRKSESEKKSLIVSQGPEFRRRFVQHSKQRNVFMGFKKFLDAEVSEAQSDPYGL